MTVWLFDLGNTRLKSAALTADGLGPVTGTAHGPPGADSPWLAMLPPQLDTAVLASVAPPGLRAALADALALRGAVLIPVQTRPVLGRLRIAYADPARLGVDRFLALLGAEAEGPGPAVVVGVGTALTIDAVDGTGLHLGGRIAPSPTLMREALQQRVAQLPASGGSYTEFAVDTDDALASGCEGAALGLIERSLAEAARRLGGMPRLLLHGGGAAALQAHLPQARMRPDLVLSGLARWYRVTAGESA